MAPKKQTKKTDKIPRTPPEKPSLKKKAQILHSQSVAAAAISTHYQKQKKLAEDLMVVACGNYEKALKDAYDKMDSRRRSRDAAFKIWDECDDSTKLDKENAYKYAKTYHLESVEDVRALKAWWDQEGKAKAEEMEKNKTETEIHLEYQLEQRRRDLWYDAAAHRNAEKETECVERRMQMATNALERARIRLENTRTDVARIATELESERAKKLGNE
jgi:hypothetical protein